MSDQRHAAESPPSPSAEDAALVQQARHGDVHAFQRLVLRYQDRLVNTCWRLSGNREDAEDLAQEAFLRAFAAINGFQRRSGFYTWLFRIAVNLAVSHRRKVGRRPALSLHEAGPVPDGVDPGSRRPGPSDDPAAVLGRRESHGLIEAALEALDDDHRAVVVLRDVEGFDYREIAAILEVSVGTVKSRLHRARMSLRERLAPVVSPGSAQPRSSR